jgi:hypothetical protein
VQPRSFLLSCGAPPAASKEPIACTGGEATASWRFGISQEDPGIADPTGAWPCWEARGNRAIWLSVGASYRLMDRKDESGASPPPDRMVSREGIELLRTQERATNLLRGSVMDARLRVVEFDGVWHRCITEPSVGDTPAGIEPARSGPCRGRPAARESPATLGMRPQG